MRKVKESPTPVVNNGPQRKWMQLRCGNAPLRRVAWYDNCPDSALDKLLRTACRIGIETEYLLCEKGGLPLAVSSSLPTAQTYELVPTVRRASALEVAKAAEAGLSVPGADAVVVVDPVSTGAVVAHQAVHRMGLQVICVWSESIPEELKGFVAHGMGISHAGVLSHEVGEVAKTAAAVRAIGANVVACIVGCETGVSLGDALAEALQLPGNGTLKSGLRRNKYAQAEAVRSAGLEAPFQMQVDSIEGVEAFLAAWSPSPYRAVVKPVEGAGSDGVSICDSRDGVVAAYRALEGTKNVLGLTNYSVLLQEYLAGEEYVVDTVSRDGVHKCVALWKYDKRVYNGAPVVYYGMQLLAIDSEPRLAEMVGYTASVLDALGIRHGCCHTEIMLVERGPVLVEVNCRIHGGEGTWAPMAEAALGYSAVTAMLDCYLDPAAFADLPVVPSDFSVHVMEAKLRSPVAGVLKSINEERWLAITRLSSFKSACVMVSVGQPIAKTIDACSASGNVNLQHESLEVLRRDYAAFHELVEAGLFEVH